MTTWRRGGDTGWVGLPAWGQIRNPVWDSSSCVWNEPTWVMSRLLSGTSMLALAVAITASGSWTTRKFLAPLRPSCGPGGNDIADAPVTRPRRHRPQGVVVSGIATGTRATRTREMFIGPASPVEVRVSLLGAFSLVVDGQPTDLPTSSERVAAFVTLRRAPVGRPLVAGTLWPDTDDTRAAASLRSALWRLNLKAPGVLHHAGTRLAVARDVSVDIYEFQDWASRLTNGTTIPEDWERELPTSLELLTDWYDDWILIERERIRQQLLYAIDQWAEGLTRKGLNARAIHGALTAVGADPLRESSHRAIVGAHIAEGNWSEALRQYTLYRENLAIELGVCPSPRMEDLIAPLKSWPHGHPTLTRETAPA
jgi:DNA-binding SARP family transcriptional activator